MTSNNEHEELWGNSFTAQALSEQLPGRDAVRWELWLRNNRNQSRAAVYRVPFERISNGTFYKPEEIAKFVAWEKSRRLGTIKMSGRAAEVMQAFGIGTATGSATGRKLLIMGIERMTDPATGQPYVQFITGDPLIVYRLEVDQALQVAAGLRTAASQPGKKRKAHSGS